jgi:hypothetical protein
MSYETCSIRSRERQNEEQQNDREQHLAQRQRRQAGERNGHQ